MHCTVPEWLHDVFKPTPWAEASLTHIREVACNADIPLFNVHSGQKTFKNLNDAKAVRDVVYQIRKACLTNLSHLLQGLVL